MSLGALGLTVAILIVPPSLAWRHIAPLGWAEDELATATGVEPAVYPGCLGTPQVTDAWRHIAKAPDAAARFRRVFAAGGQVGRLYALAGLRSTDPAAFRATLPELMGDSTLVSWHGSTVGWIERQVGELAAEIATGSVTAGLASAPYVRPTCVE